MRTLLFTLFITLSTLLSTPLFAQSHQEKALSLVEQGMQLYTDGDTDGALSAWEKALPMLDKGGETYPQLLMMLMEVYTGINDVEGQERILALATEYDSANPDYPAGDRFMELIHQALYNIMAQEDLAAALDMLAEAESMATTDEQRLYLYVAYEEYYDAVQNYLSSADYAVQRARLMAGAAPNCQDVIEAYCLAGINYCLAGEFAKAGEAFDASRQAIGKQRAPAAMTADLYGMGCVAMANKEFAAAVKFFEMCAQLAEATTNPVWVNPDQARESAKSAELLADNAARGLALKGELKSLYDAEMESENLILQLIKNRYKDSLLGAWTPLPPEELSPAEQLSLRCLILSERGVRNLDAPGDPGLDYTHKKFGELAYANSLSVIGGAYLNLGSPSRGLPYLQKVLPAMRKGLAGDFLLMGARDRANRWNKELSFLEDLYLLVDASGLSEQERQQVPRLLFDAQLLTKGVLLTSATEFEGVIRAAGDPSLMEMYDTVRENGRRLEKMRKSRTADTDAILSLERENDTLQLQLARRCAEVADYTQFLSITSQDVLAALKPGEVAIEFFTTDGSVADGSARLFAILLSPEMPQGRLVCLGTVREIRDLLESDDLFARADSGSRFWGKILRTTPGATTYYFAPDGLLHTVGIEYLPLWGTPISERKQMYRLSSTRQLAMHCERRAEPSLVFMGAIDYDDEPATDAEQQNPPTEAASQTQATGASPEGEVPPSEDIPYFAPLEGTLAELAGITQEADRNSIPCQTYVEATASKSAFKALSGHAPAILHLATHGAFLPQTGRVSEDPLRRSLLALSGANLYTGPENPGVINAAEIAAMNLRDCDLAVLSACESGLGALGADGVFGLQRGFKNAGVGTLLVSLDKVYDQQTALLMTLFYRHLLSGATPRDALRRAQSTLRRLTPNTSLLTPDSSLSTPNWARFILIDAL